jgi:hypothetical protein
MFTIEYWIRSFFGWLQRPRKRFGQFVGVGWWPCRAGPNPCTMPFPVAFFHFLGEVFWLWNMCKWGFIPWISGEIGDGLSMFIVGFSILSTDTIGFGDSHLAEFHQSVLRHPFMMPVINHTRTRTRDPDTRDQSSDQLPLRPKDSNDRRALRLFWKNHWTFVPWDFLRMGYPKNWWLTIISPQQMQLRGTPRVQTNLKTTNLRLLTGNDQLHLEQRNLTSTSVKKIIENQWKSSSRRLAIPIYYVLGPDPTKAVGGEKLVCQNCSQKRLFSEHIMGSPLAR